MNITKEEFTKKVTNLFNSGGEAGAMFIQGNDQDMLIEEIWKITEDELCNHYYDEEGCDCEFFCGDFMECK